MRKHKLISMVCERCGTAAEIDKEHSNKNFTAYKTKCSKCGGNIIPKV